MNNTQIKSAPCPERLSERTAYHCCANIHHIVVGDDTRTAEHMPLRLFGRVQIATNCDIAGNVKNAGVARFAGRQIVTNRNVTEFHCTGLVGSAGNSDTARGAASQIYANLCAEASLFTLPMIGFDKVARNSGAVRPVASQILGNLKVQTAKIATNIDIPAAFDAVDHNSRSTPTQQNNLLKNEVGHIAGKAGNSATDKTAGFCGCSLVEIGTGATQAKKKGRIAPALRITWNQILMSAGEWFLSQSFIAASMRVCQPFPVALKASITSGEYLMVADFFVGNADAGLPRRMVFLPSCRLAFSKNASSSSGASSGSTQVLFKSFNFAFIGFPHRDNAARLVALRPDHNNKPGIQFAYGDMPYLSVVLPGIFGGKVNSCENLSGSGEINTTLQQCFFSFALVVFNFHTIIVVTLNKMSKGDLLPGYAKEKGQLSALALWLSSAKNLAVVHSAKISAECVSGFLSRCRSRSSRNTLSGRNPAGLFVGAAGGCLPRFFGMRQPSDSDLVFLRWRRLISPLAAVTRNPAVLSPSSLRCSMSCITSWGILTVVICDLAFFAPVAITETPLCWCISVYAKKMIIKGLMCISLSASLNTGSDIHQLNTKPGSAATLTGPLTNNVNRTNAMATPKCTQTRPEKVVLPKLKTLTPEAEQQLTPYQKGVYHGMIEMLEMVESSLKLAGVEYQAASIQEVPHA